MSHKYYKKVVLIILDGFGVAPDVHGNAIARARTPTARVESGYCWWSGNDRALRTTVQESPRGAESARDTGDVLLSKAMAGYATPIMSGCHSPEPRAVRTTNKVADRCTSIAPSRDSRKQLLDTPYPDSSGSFSRRGLRH